MRLVQLHADRRDALRTVAEFAAAGGTRESFEDLPSEEFGRRVFPGELGHIVEVPVIHRVQHLAELVARECDIHHESILVQLGAPERGIDDVRRPVELLCRAERLTGEAVGDHEVFADVQAVHVSFSIREHRGCSEYDGRGCPPSHG